MAVFKKNGNWWIDTYVNGRRIRRKVGPDKRTAQLAEKDLKVRAARGEWFGIVHAKRISFEAFCKEFLSKQAGKAENTVKGYKQSCRLHLVPFFGDYHLPDIRPRHVEQYKEERANVAGFSTVNWELQQLSAILNTAVRWGYLKENPAKDVKALRLPQKEPPCMTREQVARLYASCDDWMHTFVATALNTGLRVSEILALTWEDIDLGNRVIKVRSNADFTTKGRRNREIPVNGFLFGVLRKAPRHIACPYVLFTSEGNVPMRSQVGLRFGVALRRARLPHFRVHDMRHTFGTTLAANRVDIVTIQNLLGHADIKNTMKYLHAAPNRNEWAVEALLLDGTTEAPADAPESHKPHTHGQYLGTGTNPGR